MRIVRLAVTGSLVLALAACVPTPRTTYSSPRAAGDAAESALGTYLSAWDDAVRLGLPDELRHLATPAAFSIERRRLEAYRASRGGFLGVLSYDVEPHGMYREVAGRAEVRIRACVFSRFVEDVGGGSTVDVTTSQALTFDFIAPRPHSRELLVERKSQAPESVCG